MRASRFPCRHALAPGLLFALGLFVWLGGTGLAREASEGWLQWGGPTHDFHAPGSGLAADWGGEGPPVLWSRELGEGYSSVLFEDGRLYTLYRAAEREVVACLDSRHGHTVWEHAYASRPQPGHVDEHGRGPRATPLLAGERLFTIGVAGILHAFDKHTGRLLWSRDLWGPELGGNLLLHGYSSSPIAYRDWVIVLVGGKEASIVALRQSDGSIVWKAQSFENSYSTPQLLEVDGELQLVALMAADVVGLNPDNGELAWSYPVANHFAQNITMPTLVDGRYLFVSAYQVGSVGLKLTRQADGSTAVEKIWSTLKIQLYHATTVRDGDWVYGSTGLRAPAFLAAVNVKSGEIGWRERGFSKANCVMADGKLFILDEDGTLAMATATPQGLTVLASAQVLGGVSYTPPTLVGGTLFVRGGDRLKALDLGGRRASR
ncbi:MAG TPA: PQQ-binding-like beta-propeller repeat protein [Thermoanaerobaculia bacterium]|nr:PQQ-binding-like beta-propeller repeat protein [Thermoanaerobaculia bacterium]